jgi:two-component sensor histidine kinase
VGGAAAATALSLVLTELVSNAAEHAFGGPDAPPCADPPEIVVRAAREGKRLRLDVDDNGRGVPEGVVTGMGTRIVETLVTTELHGRFERTRRAEGGTRASVSLTLR